MSGPRPRPNQRRAGRSQPLTGGMNNGGGAINAISFEEWRSDTDERMDRHENAQQQTALILERLTNRFDEHDRRIGVLETRPERERQTVLGMSGLALNVVYVLGLAISIFISLASHLAWH